jgi:hypothetical protein
MRCVCERVVEQAGGDALNHSPRPSVQVLAPVDVRRPDLVVVTVLASLVLDRDPQLLVGQLEAPEPFAGVLVSDDVVDGGLRETGQEDEHAQAAFRRRVDSGPDQAGGPFGQGSSPSRPR